MSAYQSCPLESGPAAPAIVGIVKAGFMIRSRMVQPCNETALLASEKVFIGLLLVAVVAVSMVHVAHHWRQGRH